jgi:hypothetical protein
VTFANPAALWLLLAVPPLLALYFLRVRRRRVRVASVLLWSTIVQNQRTARPWDRFRRHLLLWLQLLLLLLLTFALAGPSLPGTTRLGASTVWIVDGSASMTAAAPGPSRFEVARGFVLNAIGDLAPSDEGLLLLAGPDPKVLVSFTRDKDALAAAARAMQPTTAASSLGPAVDLGVALARTRPDRGLVVITDGSDRSLDLALGRHPHVAVETVGVSVSNVAITAVDLRRSPTADLESELFITLRRFGGRAGPVGVEVWRGDELLRSETVVLAPGSSVPRVYRDLGDEGGVVRVHLETGDPLAADDDAVVWLEPPRKRRVLCVGCTALTARAVLSDDRFQLEMSGGLAGREAEAEADVVIYEKVSVPPTPGAPFLALGPPRVGNQSLGDAKPWPRITAWKRGHPALRFIEPAGIIIAEARTEIPAGFAPLLESDVGPLLSTGVVGGVRGLVLHFDPLASDLPLRVAYPLLILNSVGWLTGEEVRGQARTLPAGAPLVRQGWGDDGQVVRLERPDGTRIDAPIREGTARFGALTQTGVYRVLGPDGRQERVAVNLVSDAESDLAVSSATPVAVGGAAVESVAVVGRRSIVRPVLMLAAFLLCGEWWFWQRRYRD